MKVEKVGQFWQLPEIADREIETLPYIQGYAIALLFIPSANYFFMQNKPDSKIDINLPFFKIFLLFLSLYLFI